MRGGVEGGDLSEAWAWTERLGGGGGGGWDLKNPLSMSWKKLK